jgi:hypothetical protein
MWDEAKIQHLQNALCEKIMKQLVEYNINYKYIGSRG